MNYLDQLEQIGLSQKEARVYTTLLEIGESSASDIAKKSEVNRATTYVVLDSLAEMGLVSTYDQNSTTRYVASNPDTLHQIIEHRKEELDRKETQLNELLPELKSLNNTEKAKPTIRFFAGEDGLIRSYNEFLADFGVEDETVKYFYNRDKVTSRINQEKLEEFANIRLEKNIGAEAIYTYTNEFTKEKINSEDTKIDGDEFPVSIDLEIYGDNVYLSTLEEDLSAILIKNKNIADSLKTLFKLAQIGAKAEQGKDE